MALLLFLSLSTSDLIGPAVIGVHTEREQDPCFHDCMTRQVEAIEVQAPMFPRKNFKKMKDLLLPENHDNGELVSV